jgi:hypothetical protein
MSGNAQQRQRQRRNKAGEYCVAASGIGLVGRSAIAGH